MSNTKPKLIRAKDYFIILLPILIGLISVTTAVLSHINYNTWGERVSSGGWFTVGAILASCIIIPTFYLAERQQWISRWKYTTIHGVQCFFEHGTVPYLMCDVEETTSKMYRKWYDYYTKFGDVKSRQAMNGTLSGSTCVFVAIPAFQEQTPGFKDRLVCGLAGWNWMKVSGNKPIEQTTYMHEASHIHINKMLGRMVSEDESHEIFKAVGV